ncbi:unnamed protein product [Brugia timori]|uniref:MFS domain-containing protein n=1 Tax=Brugia timori TaxID=42155 RepID=A0A0R3Q7J5_9BILA|nr:unnamed protein product [Brugia timori]
MILEIEQTTTVDECVMAEGSLNDNDWLSLMLDQSKLCIGLLNSSITLFVYLGGVIFGQVID